MGANPDAAMRNLEYNTVARSPSHGVRGLQQTTWNEPHGSMGREILSMAYCNSIWLSLFLLFLLPLLTNVEARVPRRALGPGSTVDQFLNPQNAVRQQLGLPPLRWNGNLARYAKWYANQRRKDCALVHSTANYGENLFWGRGNGWKIADAVAAWAAERRYYDYNRNVCVGKSDCLHYTQLVWRATQRVGCARIACGSGDTYIVCEYDPHGNVIGKRPY